MKMTKRIVSVFLAVLLALGSFSLIASAADVDSVRLEYKFYREVTKHTYGEDGEIVSTKTTWEPTEKVARGEHIKARLFIDTNYKASIQQIIWLYPEKFMQADYSNLTEDGVGTAMWIVTNNTSPAYSEEAGKENAYNNVADWAFRATFGTSADDWIPSQLVDDGGGAYPPYVERSEFDGMDWFATSAEAGTYASLLTRGEEFNTDENKTEYSDPYWLVEIDFNVSDTAEGKGGIYFPKGSIMTPENYLAFSTIAKTIDGSFSYAQTGDLIDVQWDSSACTADVLSLDQKITFDAGKNNTLTGTKEFSGYIGTPLKDLTGFELPTAKAASGAEFLGWTVDGVTYYADTEKAPEIIKNPKSLEDLKALALPHDETVATAVYGEPPAQETPTDAYKVEVYTENLEADKVENGEYALYSEETGTGDIGSAIPYVDTAIEGFTMQAYEDVLIEEGGKSVLKVYYTRNTVTIDINGEEKEVEYGTPIEKPNDPTDIQPGTKVDGWTVDGEVPENWPVAAEDGMIIEPIISDIIYTVTYYTDDTKTDVFAVQAGEESGYYYGDSLVYPDGKPDAETGYEFISWSKLEGTEVTGNLELTPVFEKIPVAVFFEDYNGEPLDSFEMELAYGDTLKVADLPDAADLEEITGYEFKYWTLDGEAVTADIEVTEDIVLTAHYEAVDVVLTFNANGGTFPETTTDVVTVVVKYESELTADILPEDPELEGYEFDYWVDFEEGALVDETYLDGKTFTAEWLANQDTACKVEIYTENLEADKAENGEYTLYATLKDSGETGAEIYYDNAEIEGFTMQAYEPVKITGDGNAVLKVYYTRNDVVININGKDETVEYGTPIEEPDDPTDIQPGTEVKDWTVDGEVPENWPVAAEDGMVIEPVIGNKFYAVTFMNGDQMITNEPQEYSKPIVAPAAPAAPAGYTFAGWYTDVNDAATKLTAETVVPLEGATYYAKFEATDGIKYTVNVYTENLEADKTENGEWSAYGEPIEGYGKTDDAIPYADTVIEGFTMQAYTPVKITADGKAVLNVYYTRNDVVININGKDETVEYGTPIEEPDDPTDIKPGTEVKDWTVDGEVPEKWPVAAEDGMVIEPVIGNKFYAVTFMNGDQMITNEAQEYSKPIVAPADIVETGYTFGGWYTDLNDESTKLTAETVVPVDGATYYAKLTVNKYTVTFVGDDGSELKKVENVAYGTDLSTIAPEAPAVEGKTFSAWIDTDNKIMSTMPDSDMTYTATYASNDSATYAIKIYVMDVDGNYTLKTNTTAKAPIGTVVSIEDESDENIGCYLDTAKSNLSATVAASGTVLEAYYARNYVTITFVDEDGVEVAPAVKGYYGSAVTAPEAEERDFYTFEGWNPEVPATMPLEDLTVVAKYERVPVKLVAVDGSTTQIDNKEWLITGIAPNIRSAADYDEYLTVEGDGYYKVTPVYEYKYGTGSKVELIDNFDGRVLETYYIVIYGDINGDGQVDAGDSSLARNEYLGKTWWSDDTEKEYNRFMTLAADLNQNGIVDVTDRDIINMAAGGAVEIDQVTLEII